MLCIEVWVINLGHTLINSMGQALHKLMFVPQISVLSWLVKAFRGSNPGASLCRGAL